MVVRDRLAAGRHARDHRAGTGLRLPGDLLPHPRGRRRRASESLCRDAADLRPRRVDRPARRAAASRPAHRAAWIRHRRRGRGRHPRDAARLAVHAPGPGRREPLPRPARERRRRLRVRPRPRRDATGAAARRGRLLAQGSAPGAGQPLLQPAATRGDRHADPRRRATARAGPRLARPRVERVAARRRRGRLGLDRHEPVRRQRPHRLRAAPRRRQRAVGRRQRPRTRAVPRVRSRQTRCTFTPGRRWPEPASRTSYPVEWQRRQRRLAATPCAHCWTIRNWTAARAPVRSTGKAWPSYSTRAGGASVSAISR